MPIHLEWYIKHRVIEERAWDVLSLQDLQQHSDGLAVMLKDAQEHAPGQMVYLLFDDRELESMPPIYRMPKVALPIIRFKNRGPMFHVTTNNTYRNIMALCGHVMKFTVHAFTTREEAIKAIDAIVAQDTRRLMSEKTL